MSSPGGGPETTATFREAVAEAEALIRGASFVKTEQDPPTGSSGSATTGATSSSGGSGWPAD